MKARYCLLLAVVFTAGIIYLGTSGTRAYLKCVESHSQDQCAQLQQ